MEAMIELPNIDRCFKQHKKSQHSSTVILAQIHTSTILPALNDLSTSLPV